MKRASSRRRTPLRKPAAFFLSRWTLALVAILAPFVFLSDFLLLQRVFFYFDFEVQWIPFHQFAHAALMKGDTVLWNPFIMLGFPQHAESQLGTFYPLNWLLHLLPSQAYAVALSLYLHLCLGFVATYLLARAYRLEVYAALQAAIAFAFSGFVIAQFTNYNIALVAVYLPLKLLLITYYFERRRVDYLLYFALASGAELLVSHANMSFITTVTAGLYFMTLAVMNGRAAFKDIGIYIGCSMIAILLAAVQLVPTYEFLTQSERSGGISYESATSWSHSFTYYLTAFFPMMFGTASASYTGGSFEEFYFYVGTITVLLALLGAVVFLKRRDNRYLAVLSVVAVFAFFVSLGANNPLFDLYRWLIKLPGFGFFRSPARWSIVPALALAILSAYGMQALLGYLRAGRIARPVLILIAAAVVVPLLIYVLGWKDDIGRATVWWNILRPLATDLSHLSWVDRHLYALFTVLNPLAYFLLLLLVLLGIIVGSYRLPLKYAAVAILVVSFADLLLVLKPANPSMPADFYAQRPPHIDYLQEHGGLARTMTADDVPNMMGVSNSVGAFYGVPSIKGYVSMRLRNYVMLEEPLKRADFQDYVGVKYEIVRRGDGYQINHRSSAYPRAFVAERYLMAEDDVAAFEAFLRLSNDDKKVYAVLSESSVTALALPGDVSLRQRPPRRAPTEVTITAYENARVEMRVDSATRGFLVLTDMYYPGWRAWVNGQEQPIVPVQGVFRGVYLSRPGAYTVEMRYEPASFRAGARLSILALLIVASFGYWLIRRRPRNRNRRRGGVSGVGRRARERLKILMRPLTVRVLRYVSAANVAAASAPSKIYFLLMIFAGAVFGLTIVSVLPHEVSDEGFHAPQIWSFFGGNNDLIPQLTVPPTYHVAVAMVAKLLGFYTVDAARFISAAVALLALPVFYQLVRRRYPQEAPIRTMQLFFLPAAFCFFFLIYTDIWALAAILLLMLMMERGRHGWAALAGLIAVALRPDAIVWVALALLIVCARPWREIRGDLPDWLKRSIAVGAPYLVVLALFGAFVIWNKGVAIGDSGQHRFAFNLTNLWVFLVVGWLLFLPFNVAQSSAILRLLAKPWVPAALVAGFVLYMATFNNAHPYNHPNLDIFLRNRLLGWMTHSDVVRALFYVPLAWMVLALATVRLPSRAHYWLFIIAPLSVCLHPLIEVRYYLPAFALLLAWRQPVKPLVEATTVAVYLPIAAYVMFGVAMLKFFP
jgi:alpha-1,2-glucosyltransferase